MRLATLKRVDLSEPAVGLPASIPAGAASFPDVML